AAAQNLPLGPAPGSECYLSLPGSEGDLYRTVSVAAAAGGGALSRGAAAERESRYQRDHVYCLRFVRAGVSGEPDCGYERAQRASPPQGAHELYLRPEPLHVLWTLRGRLSRGCARTYPGLRTGQLYARGRDLESRDAGEGSAADAV